MSAARHARVKQIFLAAREAALEDREELVARLCSGDEALRREVQSFLRRARDEPVARTEPAPFVAPESRLACEKSLAVAGYRILQKIGEGGMGEVYEAEQHVPIRRRVALKVLKGGLESKEVLARFESERQALAMMSHPNIARVFEAGVSERQRPFFAMELVHGEAITGYCDRHRLITHDRLALFVDACAGVQHAHHKGIIHRDIKPSNVLVTVEDGRAVPKIIDFGVAKAVAQPLTERTLFTELGQWIGTPMYMSPEQAEMGGLDIDTRSDVYSLGVLLYELLSGAPPLDSKALGEAGLDEIRRKIREDEPARPSTRVSGLGDDSSVAARNRQADIPTLVQQLRGDLDWITMRALEKDRTRRYASPSELAADIRRHLHNEPVAARPPSTLYKLDKFVRRNRLVVTASSLVACALVFGLAMTILALQVAKREAENASQAASFLEKLFDDVNPFAERTVASAEIMLDRAVDRMTTELAGQELVQARLMSRIGVAYRDLGLFDRARSLLERSLTILVAEHGREHVDVAVCLHELGMLAWEIGDYKPAMQFLEEGLGIKRRLLDAEDPRIADAETELGFITWALGDYDRAEELVTGALPIQERAYGQHHVVVARNLFVSGILFNSRGEYRRARAALERSLSIRIDSFGPDHLHVGWTTRALARSLMLLGEYEEALESAQRALTIMETSLGSEHTDLAYALATLGSIHRELGNYGRAHALLERSLTQRLATLGPDHIEIGLSRLKLSWLYLDLNDPVAAGPLIEGSFAVGPGGLPPGHPWVGWKLHALSRQRLQSGRLDEALTLQHEAIEIIVAALGDDHAHLAAHRSNLGVVLRAKGEHDAARSHLVEALRLYEEMLGPSHRMIANTLRELAVLHDLIGETDLAGQRFAQALTMYEIAVSGDHPSVAGCLRAYAAHLRQSGEHVEADAAERRAVAIEDARAEVPIGSSTRFASNGSR